MSKEKNSFMMGSGMGVPHDNFIWVGEIHEDSLIEFYRQFTAKEEDSSVSIIPIVISSYGGEVASMMAMRDLIKSSSKPVTTIALGKAMSAGACLLAAGTKGYRFASEDTIIMIHEVSGGAMGKTADVAESAAVMAELNSKLFDNLAKDCGKTVEEIEHQIRSRKNTDWTMTSQAAKKWGIIDQIAIPRHTFQPPASLLVNLNTYEEKQKSPKKKRSKK